LLSSSRFSLDISPETGTLWTTKSCGVSIPRDALHHICGLAAYASVLLGAAETMNAICLGHHMHPVDMYKHYAALDYTAAQKTTLLDTVSQKEL